MNQLICLIVSFLIVAFGQSSWVPFLGPIAAMGGYALFWKGMLMAGEPLKRFFISTFWFMAVQGVQLSWLATPHYMGVLILLVYILVILALGIQFGCLSSFLSPDKSLSFFGCVSLAGGWIFFEWIRIYFLTGFTWNPVGLALASHSLSLQLAAFIGIYGLSFWVILTNMFVLNGFKRSWGLALLFPYALGFIHQSEWAHRSKTAEIFRVALVDTALLVEEKHWVSDRSDAFIDPLDQWGRVFEFLAGEGPLDLIVLPEAAFPHGKETEYCSHSSFCEVWKHWFGKASLDVLPRRSSFFVGNAYIAQALANQFKADLIIGLDFKENGQMYNGAFYFQPYSGEIHSYKKRILAPVGEYIPLENNKWVRKFLKNRFQIESSFKAGDEAVIFPFKQPIGISICLEEVYPELIRDLKCQGAKLLVSLSSDVWFPFSKLGRQHLDHGRIRSVENGLFLLRSVNMGCSAVIDCFGNIVEILENQEGALILNVPMISHSTWYTKIGALPIVLSGSFCFFLFIIQWFRKKRTSQSTCV
jgi:apolipoprotein N-acyltransferase